MKTFNITVPELVFCASVDDSVKRPLLTQEEFETWKKNCYNSVEKVDVGKLEEDFEVVFSLATHETFRVIDHERSWHPINNIYEECWKAIKKRFWRRSYFKQAVSGYKIGYHRKVYLKWHGKPQKEVAGLRKQEKIVTLTNMAFPRHTLFIDKLQLFAGSKKNISQPGAEVTLLAKVSVVQRQGSHLQSTRYSNVIVDLKNETLTPIDQGVVQEPLQAVNIKEAFAQLRAKLSS